MRRCFAVLGMSLSPCPIRNVAEGPDFRKHARELIDRGDYCHGNCPFCRGPMRGVERSKGPDGPDHPAFSPPAPAGSEAWQGQLAGGIHPAARPFFGLIFHLGKKISPNLQWAVDAFAKRGYSRRLHRAMVTNTVAASHGAE